MRDIRKYSIYPNNLDIYASFKKVENYLMECGYKEETNTSYNCIKFIIRLGDNRRLDAADFNEFLRLLNEYPHALPIYTHSHWEKKNGKIGLGIDVDLSGIDIEVASPDMEVISGIHDKVAQIYQAKNPIQDKSQFLSRFNLKKSIFLAHKFDEAGKDLAYRLSSFLTRLGFDVVEGEGYETRDIPDKVSERIRSQDIFICVVTPGEHSWILSETAFAKGLNRYIVILCQDDISFSKGIVGGDYEHLPFPKDQIEKTFTDLLYILPK